MRRSVSGNVVPALAAAVALAVTLAGAAAAETAAEFYKGRRIELLVGLLAGDGYDAYARLLTRHMARHIPGEPTFIVRNMAGGGGRPAVNRTT